MVPIFEEPIFGSYDENFISYAAAALLCAGCFFFPLLSTALLALIEKMEGIMERMMVAGVSANEMILSLLIIQIVVHILQTAIVMGVLFWIYDNPLKGSIMTLGVLMLLTGTSGMFQGFLLAAICDTVFLTGYGAAGINFVICLTSGLLWPTEGGHYILRSMSWFLPMSKTVEAARAICLKNFRLTSSTVLTGFASAVAWNIAMFTLIWWFVKHRKGRLEARKK